jgi:hypothetical protein
MRTHARSNFKIDSWEERSYLDRHGERKLTRAHVEQTFEGDIQGRGEVEWLMCYRPDQTADYVGLQHIVGSLQGRSGSLVLTTTGTFDGTQAKGPVAIVFGSGTGELAGVSGDGELHAPVGQQPSLKLSYRFE